MNFSKKLQEDLLNGGSIVFSKSKNGLTHILVQLGKPHKTRNKSYDFKRYVALQDEELEHEISLNGTKRTLCKKEEELFEDYLEHLKISDNDLKGKLGASSPATKT